MITSLLAFRKGPGDEYCPGTECSWKPCPSGNSPQVSPSAVDVLKGMLRRSGEAADAEHGTLHGFQYLSSLHLLDNSASSANGRVSVAMQRMQESTPTTLFSVNMNVGSFDGTWQCCTCLGCDIGVKRGSTRTDALGVEVCMASEVHKGGLTLVAN